MTVTRHTSKYFAAGYVAASFIALTTRSVAAAPAAKQAVPRQIWVKLGTDGRDASIVRALNGAKLVEGAVLSRQNVLRKYSFRVPRAQWQWVLVQLPRDESIFQVKKRFEKSITSPRRRLIGAIEPNWIWPRLTPPPRTLRPGRLKSSPASVGVRPDDPLFKTCQTALQHIGAPAAWRYTRGCSTVVVAVLDTGIYYNPYSGKPAHETIHVDLRDNVWRNSGEMGIDAQGRNKATNKIDDDGNAWIDDVMGIDPTRKPGAFNALLDDIKHGTKVAGIIAAVGNNGRGIAGVCWRVKFMPVRCMGAGNGPLTLWIGDSYEYVVDMRRRGVPIQLINNSWGFPLDSAVVRDQVDKAARMGIISVCSAGNDGLNIDDHPFYPAAYPSPGVIAVAASTIDDKLAMDTSFGMRSVDLAAPGDFVYSTTGGDEYESMEGTSAATPLVTGALALMLCKNPRLTMPQMRRILLHSVEKGTGQPDWPWRHKVASGGRLDLARALANTPSGN